MTHSDKQTETMAENLSDTARRTAEDLKETGKDALQGAKAAMSGAMSDLRAGAAAKADEVREVIAEEGERMAQSLREAASSQSGGVQGRVLETMASGVHAMSDTIRSRDMNTLMSDVQSFAKRNPALFIAGAAVTGLFLARLAAQAGRSATDDGGIGTYGQGGMQAGDMGSGLQAGGMGGAGMRSGAGQGMTDDDMPSDGMSGGMIDDAMGGGAGQSGGKRGRKASGSPSSQRGDDLSDEDIERGPSMGGNL